MTAARARRQYQPHASYLLHDKKYRVLGSSGACASRVRRLSAAWLRRLAAGFEYAGIVGRICGATCGHERRRSGANAVAKVGGASRFGCLDRSRSLVRLDFCLGRARLVVKEALGRGVEEAVQRAGRGAREHGEPIRIRLARAGPTITCRTDEHVQDDEHEQDHTTYTPVLSPEIIMRKTRRDRVAVFASAVSPSSGGYKSRKQRDE